MLCCGVVLTVGREFDIICVFMLCCGVVLTVGREFDIICVFMLCCSVVLTVGREFDIIYFCCVYFECLWCSMAEIISL
jgi:hypothetical protein